MSITYDNTAVTTRNVSFYVNLKYCTPEFSSPAIDDFNGYKNIASSSISASIIELYQVTDAAEQVLHTGFKQNIHDTCSITVFTFIDDATNSEPDAGIFNTTFDDYQYTLAVLESLDE